MLWPAGLEKVTFLIFSIFFIFFHFFLACFLRNGERLLRCCWNERRTRFLVDGGDKYRELGNSHEHQLTYDLFCCVTDV